MRTFEIEILTYVLVIFVPIITLIFVIGKYTDFFEDEDKLSEIKDDFSKMNDMFLRSKRFLIWFVLILAFVAFQGNIEMERETLLKIKNEHITPVRAAARIEHKMPGGIMLKLYDGHYTTYQIDLEDESLRKEFVDKINKGYTVSKFENSTDILLVNGSDSVYYNLYY
ncbi:MAG: hypothetical protein K2M07_06635 [Muribaculaceae bacterium]|nr:hypothetical protein [Muribaculaceae bacterium]